MFNERSLQAAGLQGPSVRIICQCGGVRVKCWVVPQAVSVFPCSLPSFVPGVYAALACKRGWTGDDGISRCTSPESVLSACCFADRCFQDSCCLVSGTGFYYLRFGGDLGDGTLERTSGKRQAPLGCPHVLVRVGVLLHFNRLSVIMTSRLLGRCGK